MTKATAPLLINAIGNQETGSNHDEEKKPYPTLP